MNTPRAQAAQLSRGRTVSVAALRWKELRLSRGWTQSNVLRRLEDLARDGGVPLPTRSSLKTMLSRWENGHRVSDLYTVLLCRVFELPLPFGGPARVRRERCHNSRLYAARCGSRVGVMAR